MGKCIDAGSALACYQMLSPTILQSVPVRKASSGSRHCDCWKRCAQEETKRLHDVFEVLKEPSLHKLAIIFKSVRLARALKKVMRVSALVKRLDNGSAR